MGEREEKKLMKKKFSIDAPLAAFDEAAALLSTTPLCLCKVRWDQYRFISTSSFIFGSAKDAQSLPQ